MSIPVLLVSVALIALESWRPIKIKYFDIEMPVSTHVLDDLDSSGKPYVLAMAPMGFREIDSQHMLQIAGSRRLFVYAWGGTYPDYTTKVQAAISGKRANPEKAHYLLSQLWPECYLLEDKTAARGHGPFQSYREAFAGVADVVSEDAKYALMRLKPTEPATNNLRIVRTDMLEDGKSVSFALASAAPGRRVHLSLNGMPLGEYDSSFATNCYKVPLPGRGYEKTLPNRFVFESKEPVTLSGFSIDR